MTLLVPSPNYHQVQDLVPEAVSNQARLGQSLTKRMNSTKVQNPRHKMQVALLAEPKTPLESSVFI